MSQKYEYFGKYILLEKLAVGGMAEVWLARAPGAGGIGKFVAIKKILPQFSDNPEFLQMFKDEATIAMNLSHSNIVSIYELGQEKNQLFLVMDYVEGRNLRQILNKLKQTSGKFSIDQIVYAIKEIATGLDHAHRSLNSATGKPLNITHRDISPQNVMVTFEGEIKIVDFGIAKAESQIENTRAGTLKGKFGYMSPEQAEGHSTDLRTDIFSLGIVLWELIANDRLFVANNEINTLKKIRECNIPALTKLNPNLNPELERITMKALTRDRNLRYQTAAALHRDLNRFLNRQYPDFSSHDFSVFIKTLYTDEILEVRKRLIDYSKITLPSDKNSADEFDLEKTEVSFPAKVANPAGPKEYDRQEVTITETETFSESLSNAVESDTKSDIAEVDFKKEISSVNILNDAAINKTLKDKLVVEPKAPNSTRLASEDSMLDLSLDHTGSHAPQTPIPRKNKRQNAKPQSYSSAYIMIAVASAILVYSLGTNYFPREVAMIDQTIKKFLSYTQPITQTIINGGEKVAVPQYDLPVESQIPDLAGFNPDSESLASETTIDILQAKTLLVVNSNPSGAAIYLNGKSTGKSTPGRIDIPTDAKFSLTLKLPRFIDYTRSGLTAELTGRTFTATLQKAMVSYVDIDVKPPLNVKVYVNGKYLKDEILPISKYAIPAGSVVLIRAENPVTGEIAEETVTLKEDQRYRVLLKLDKKRTPSGL